MFTLITLVLLALLAGGAYTVKRVLNKKREAISHVRKAYTPEVLKAFEEACILDDSEVYITTGAYDVGYLPMDDKNSTEDTSIIIRCIRKKRISRTKHKKRFTNHVVRFM